MTPAQRLAYNLASRGIIAQRNGKKWNLLQTTTATATRALFDPATISTATYKAIPNARNGYTHTTRQAQELLK